MNRRQVWTRKNDRFRNILSEVSDKDVIIILSTHIVGDISSTCKKLALLNKGELKFEMVLRTI